MSDQIGRPGRFWLVPDGYSLSRCRGCDAEVLWVTTPSGAKAPMDPDGMNHFATCPERDRFRRPRP